LIAGNDVEGDADAKTCPGPGAEIGMDMASWADGIDISIGVGIQRQVVHRGVPDVISGQEGAAGKEGSGWGTKDKRQKDEGVGFGR